jgi:hypothetical protein
MPSAAPASTVTERRKSFVDRREDAQQAADRGKTIEPAQTVEPEMHDDSTASAASDASAMHEAPSSSDSLILPFPPPK